MFYDRLKEACSKNKTSVTAVLKSMGLGTANGTYWKNGSIPSSDIVVQLAELLQISTDYLLTGKEKCSAADISADELELLSYYKDLDTMEKGRVLGKAEELAEAARTKRLAKKCTPKKSNKAITPSVTVEPEQTTEAPENEYIYLDFPALPASAGTGVYIDSDYTEPLKVRADKLTCEANYALRVSGDSMQPRYFDGDIVLVQTQPCVDPGEIGIFIYNDEAYIKQFGGNRLISINPNYDDIQITDPDSCYCKGKVIGVLDPIKYL